jgi:hypothetical protein
MHTTKALDVEEKCIIEFLKQRELLNETTFPNFYVRSRAKDCDQIVKKFVKSIYEANFDYLEENSAVDNKTYQACLKTEFDRHKMNEKFLKVKVFEDDSPEKAKLEKIRDDFLLNIKFICSKTFEKVATKRFKDFVPDQGEPSASKHPAFVKIRENLVCMNLYAVEKKIIDPEYYQLNLKLINQTDEGCKQVVSDVRELIMDEWHIRRVSEDDRVQRCFNEILLDTEAIELFIKNCLLSQLTLNQEHKDYERENFVRNAGVVQEKFYKCMSNDFEEI